MSPVVTFTRYVFMFMFTLTNSSANMAGFHFEYHKNEFVLVEGITELLYSNDVVFFVQCPMTLTGLNVMKRTPVLQFSKMLINVEYTEVFTIQ